jgi:phage-related protein
VPGWFRACSGRIVERVQALGLERVREPPVKHLRGKLWEMRLSARVGIGRAIYVTAVGRRVVIVLAFVKKTQQTPHAVLALAERRAKEAGL